MRPAARGHHHRQDNQDLKETRTSKCSFLKLTFKAAWEMPTGPGNLQFWEHSPGGAGARAGTRGYGDNRAGSRGAKVFQLSSSQRDGSVPGRHLAISGDILGCHNNGELLAPSGWRPGMLLNLRSAQDSLHHKESSGSNVSIVSVRNPATYACLRRICCRA